MIMYRIEVKYMTLGEGDQGPKVSLWETFMRQEQSVQGFMRVHFNHARLQPHVWQVRMIDESKEDPYKAGTPEAAIVWIAQNTPA